MPNTPERISPPTTSSAAPNQLARVVGFWGAVWMGLGSILGTGVFVSLGISAGIVGSSMVLAVALAAFVATANGLSSAQLAANLPVSGGTYAYARAYLHPLAGFAAGWMFLAAKSASAATAAQGFSGYLLYTLGYSPSRITRTALALALVIALTALVATGLKRSNTANILIVSFTMLALGSFVFFGLLSLSAASFQQHLGPTSLFAGLSRPTAMLEATALMFVAYTGYGRIATLGEEVHEPAKVIPRAIVGTLLISMILYLSVSIVAVAVAGADAFGKAAQSAAPLERIARSFRVPQIAYIVSLGAVTAMAGVLLNLLLGLSRVLFAMARDHEAPQTFSHVDERTESPDRAVWGVGILIASLVLLGDIRTTWSFSAFTVLIYYGFTNLCALQLSPQERRFHPSIALFGLLSCFGLAFFVPPKVWIAGLSLLAFGFVLRLFFVKQSAS